MFTCPGAYGFNHHALLPLPGAVVPKSSDSGAQNLSCVSWRCRDGANKPYQATYIILDTKKKNSCIYSDIPLFDYAYHSSFSSWSSSIISKNTDSLNYLLTTNFVFYSHCLFFLIISFLLLAVFHYSFIKLCFWTLRVLNLTSCTQAYRGEIEHWGTPILPAHPFWNLSSPALCPPLHRNCSSSPVTHRLLSPTDTLPMCLLLYLSTVMDPSLRTLRRSQYCVMFFNLSVHQSITCSSLLPQTP